MGGMALAMAQSSQAEDITIANPYQGATFGSYTDSRGLNVDQAVTPNCVASQEWDLEALLINGSMLYVVGGFNYANGQVGNGHLFTSGDIFIDINNYAKVTFVQNPAPTVNGNFELKNDGWEYAVNFDFSTPANYKYNVYALDNNSILNSVYYRQNDEEGNPFELLSVEESVKQGQLEYKIFNTDDLLEAWMEGQLNLAHKDFYGDKHYVLGVSLADLGIENMNVQFTMACGNDVVRGLMTGGAQTVPDGGVTIMFLGMGLSMLGLVAKRLHRNA